MNSKIRKGLFTESLENISRNLFRDHIEIITELIEGSSGIYALYDENELYYVGRASDLKRRVHQHLKDRHDSQWTHFSLFLIKRADYIGDIESLLIRIAEPVGNRAKPRGRDSKTLIRKLKGLIQQKHKEELRELISGRTVAKRKISKKSHRGTLKGLVAKRTPIYRTYKGKEFKAILNPGGTISYNRKSFLSPTAAAKSIVGERAINGWNFWTIKNANGEWIRLSDY